MRDREFVNRFCAFQLLDLEQYKGSMDDFLALVLKKMNNLEDQDLSRLSMEFRRGLANNYAVFGRHAFRKHSQGQEKRGVINASLWDVMSTGLSRYQKEMVESRVEELKNKFYLLMDNDDFVSSITYGPSNVKKVHHRFLVAGIMFERVLSAHTT